jgi:hypothetical protein
MLALVAAMAVPARADVAPAGPSFVVNTYTTGYQNQPAVGIGDTGNFVIVWASDGFGGPTEDGSGSGVFGRRFAASGTALGGEFPVNAFTPQHQTLPAIAANGSGFVVSWQSGNYFGPGPDGSAFGAFVRRFDDDGTPLGGDVQANTFTAGPQSRTDVARDASGNFVVVWESGNYTATQDGSYGGIFGQRFAAGGAPLGGEFQVNVTTLGRQGSPAVTSDAVGNFVVVWQSYSYVLPQDGDAGSVVGRRFAANGAPLGGEFLVNTYTTGTQDEASVAADSSGNFVVVWRSGYYDVTQDGSNGGIFAQRFDASGARLGGELQVNTTTAGDQDEPRAAVDADGNFLVVWRGPKPLGEGVFGQHFTNDGVAIGSEFEADTGVGDYTGAPAVGASPTGDFVVTWDASYPSPDGDGSAVVARRFTTTATAPPIGVTGNRLVLKEHAGDPSRKVMIVRSSDPSLALGGGDGSGDDPTLSGGSLRVRSAGFDTTYTLPPPGWHYAGPPGTNGGYVYRDRFLNNGPIQAVTVKGGRLVKIVGRGAQLGHDLGANPYPVVVTLQTGAKGRRDCMTFGGTAVFKPGALFRAGQAPAAPCPR